MKKPSIAAMLALGFLGIAIILLFAGYLILRPEFSRPQLLGLLAESSTNFFLALGTSRLGWMLSVIFALGAIVVSLAMKWTLEGKIAMMQHWAQSAVWGLLILELECCVYGGIFLHTVAHTAFEDRRQSTSIISQLQKDAQESARNSEYWRARALKTENLAKSDAAASSDDARVFVRDTRVAASALLEFQAVKLQKQPTLILGGTQESTQNSMERANRYDSLSVMEFLKTFGAKISGITQRASAFGLDTSRLERHIAELNGIPMLRLISDDLNYLADQVSSGKRAPIQPYNGPSVMIIQRPAK